MAALDAVTTLTNLRTSLASMTSWQSIVGVATAAEALEKIFIGGVPEDTEGAVPSIVLEVSSVPLELAGGHFRTSSMTINVWCELAVPSTSMATYEDQYLYVWGKWSAIMAEFSALAIAGSTLMTQRIQQVQLPGRKDSNLNQGRKEWGFTIAVITHFI